MDSQGKTLPAGEVADALVRALWDAWPLVSAHGNPFGDDFGRVWGRVSAWANTITEREVA